MALFVRNEALLEKLPKRFLNKIVRSSSGCWNWIGCVHANGYGHVRFNGRVLMAHRVVFTLLVREIQSPLTLDHLCRNRKCVNPKHLEIVTLKENILRGNGAAAQNSRRNRCVLGHPFDSKNTWYAKNRIERVCRICAARRSRKYQDSIKDKERSNAN